MTNPPGGALGKRFVSASRMESKLRRRDALHVRSGEPLEGVRHPDVVVPDAVSAEDAAHEDRRSTASDSGLDELAGNALCQRLLDAGLEVRHPPEADHRMGLAGLVAPELPELADVLRRGPR